MASGEAEAGSSAGPGRAGESGDSATPATARRRLVVQVKSVYEQMAAFVVRLPRDARIRDLKDRVSEQHWAAPPRAAQQVSAAPSAPSPPAHCGRRSPHALAAVAHRRRSSSAGASARTTTRWWRCWAPPAPTCSARSTTTSCAQRCTCCCSRPRWTPPGRRAARRLHPGLWRTRLRRLQRSGRSRLLRQRALTRRSDTSTAAALQRVASPSGSQPRQALRPRMRTPVARLRSVCRPSWTRCCCATASWAALPRQAHLHRRRRLTLLRRAPLRRKGRMVRMQRQGRCRSLRRRR